MTCPHSGQTCLMNLEVGSKQIKNQQHGRQGHIKRQRMKPKIFFSLGVVREIKYIKVMSVTKVRLYYSDIMIIINVYKE